MQILPGVGPRLGADLGNLGIKNLTDLTEFLPKKHENYDHVTSIKDISEEQIFLIKARLLSVNSRRSFRRRLSVQEGLLNDKTGNLKVVWFNQPYLAELKEGSILLLRGAVKKYRGRLTLVGPEIIRDPDILSGRKKLQPIYALSGRLTTRQIRFWAKLALSALPQKPDFLPVGLTAKHKLLDRTEALRQVHFPDSSDTLARAKKRLAFEELLLLSLYILRERKAIEQAKAVPIKIDKELLQNFVAGLPFKLTEAQRKAAWQILKDLARPRPTNRLLEGDVGSGKTLVATLALLSVAASGGQAVILAPTQVLAHQHVKNIRSLLNKQFTRATGLSGSAESMASSACPSGIALYTGTSFEDEHGRELSRAEFLERLASGLIKLVVATHAILKPAVKFKDLQLFVVDEQHRFGVKQRQLLKTKVHKSGYLPHLLSMTATPIPRSLALTLYGDLDLSILDEKPGKRQDIDTQILPANKLDQAYARIKERARKGEQAFIIFPLIDSSEFIKARALLPELEQLKKSLVGLRVRFLHGRMPEEEKAEILGEFAANKFDVLAATPVIEVGIDITDATTIMVMSANRFGLAQLHQLRGRVGRDNKAGSCFLCPDEMSPATSRRLQLLCESNDGFKLAEADLELRGPGEIFGTMQHGQATFKYSNFLDIKVLATAKEEAANLLHRDPSLSLWPNLQKKVVAVARTLHLE